MGSLHQEDIDELSIDLKSIGSGDSFIGSEDMNIQTAQDSDTSWLLDSIEVNENQKIVLKFSTGAEIEFDPTSMNHQKKTLTIGKKQLMIEQSGDFCSVEIDGITFKNPSPRVA